MQEFLTNNTVSCNLMSLTGYRTLVVLRALLESPKSNDEINEILLNNQYIGEKFSSDTLRIYINSLRAVGCKITRANKSNGRKYVLISHPFNYDISESQFKAISKVYKSLYAKVGLMEVLKVENFFRKLCGHLQNTNTIELLSSISMLKNVDRDILDNLFSHCEKRNQITILYNSPKSGNKKIEMIVDKLSFKSENLYLYGYSITHREYSYLMVERILEICEISLFKSNNNFSSSNIIYEVYNNNEGYVLESDEKIIEESDSKLVIESNEKNEFDVMQRILYMASDCKVIQPAAFKRKVLNKLKAIEKNYEEI